MKSHVLLTGVTGFVGKVVLFELLRRREELGLERVTVLIRAKKRGSGAARTPRERFVEDVAPAALFEPVRCNASAAGKAWPDRRLQRIGTAPDRGPRRHCETLHPHHRS